MKSVSIIVVDPSVAIEIPARSSLSKSREKTPTETRIARDAKKSSRAFRTHLLEI